MAFTSSPVPALRLFAGACGLLAGLSLGGCDSLIGKAECETDSDCGAGERCAAQVCEPLPVECTVDTDCPSGICRDNECAPALGVDDDEDPVSTGGGTVEIDPGYELDFGSPVLGVAIVRTVGLTNVGGSPVEISAAALSAETSDEYSVDAEPALPLTLAPGDRAEVNVSYTLADGEDDQGELFVTTTAQSCAPACADPANIAVALYSEFKGGRELALTPEEHDFGYVPAGSESTVATLLMTNEGTLDKVLTVDAITLAGDTEAFSFTLPDLPLYLAPGESYDVPVSYAPSAPATGHEMTFTVNANSDSPPQRVLTSTFRGTSQPPNALVFDPVELVFPELAIGTSAQQQSRLENVGGTPVQVTDLVFDVGAEEYSYVAFGGGNQVTFPRVLLPGDYVDVYVEYVSQTGEPSLTKLSALNDQPSGQVPTLTLRGESYIPPGGPVLDVVSGPETKLDSGCGCQATADVSAANVDLSYRAQSGGSTCGKPANPACGTGGVNCDCSTMGTYGNVRWGGARVEEVRGETWIIDEAIHHSGDGVDGSFVVRSDLLDNCLAVPGSTDASVNHACCMWVDCETGTQACFEYTSDYPHCATECEYHATVATSQDCLARGAVAIRTEVRISLEDGSLVEERHFCTAHATSGAGSDVVTLSRTAGYFQIESVKPGVTEVGVGQPCPAP